MQKAEVYWKNASQANLLAVLGLSIRLSSRSSSSSSSQLLSLFEDSVISLRGVLDMKFGEFCGGDGEAVKLYTGSPRIARIQTVWFQYSVVNFLVPKYLILE